jgi:hypothetical protein
VAHFYILKIPAFPGGDGEENKMDLTKIGLGKLTAFMWFTIRIAGGHF